MKICIIGTGYVGLVTGAGFAEMGNDVICVDNDESKIKLLSSGVIPFYEPNLAELVSRNFHEGRLSFTSDLKDGVARSLFIFICVGTPQGEDGSPDMRAYNQVICEIKDAINGYKIIVNKSTVPVGTQRAAREYLLKNVKYEFDVVSNPEFLKEGAAVDDFMKPDRVVIGSENARTTELLKELYAPFVRTKNPILIMDPASSELSKYASNCILATRISFMNEIALLCEKVGANIDSVREVVGSDGRVGPRFLFAGIGYGGSCFPKDLESLRATAHKNGMELTMLNATIEINKKQREFLFNKLLNHFSGDLKGKKIAIWGLSFKPNTDDIREAPALVLIEKILRSGGTVQCYDPCAIPNAKKVFGDTVTYCENHYDALCNADAVVLCTEWGLFRNPDFEKVKSLMKEPLFFDGRNLYNPNELRKLGFTYYSVGRR